MTEETRIALLEQSIGHINETLVRLENKIDKLDGKVDKLDGKLDSRFIWLLTFMIAGFSASFGMLAHAMHIF